MIQEDRPKNHCQSMSKQRAIQRLKKYLRILNRNRLTHLGTSFALLNLGSAKLEKSRKTLSWETIKNKYGKNEAAFAPYSLTKQQKPSIHVSPSTPVLHSPIKSSFANQLSACLHPSITFCANTEKDIHPGKNAGPQGPTLQMLHIAMYTPVC